MIWLREGNQVHQLLTLLSVSGEFPAKSLKILGNERVIKRLIHKLESSQEIRSAASGNRYTTKLFQVSGTRDKRTVRLYKGGLPVLNELHPKAESSYLETFQSHKFSGDTVHMWRNHRIGEALAMCMMAGIEIRPYVLPALHRDFVENGRSNTIGFFTSRSVKSLNASELNKTRYTRLVGVLFYSGGCYAVYNTRDAIMKWSGMGEQKAQIDISSLSRMNGNIDEVNSALLFGVDPDVALQTLIESDMSQKLNLRFDRIYHHVYYIPMNKNGFNLLKILTAPDWHETLMQALFRPEMRLKGYGFMEFDAFHQNKYIFSHLDSDIARLMRFKEALETQTEEFEVLCFPWQGPFLKQYLCDRVEFKVIQMEDALLAMKL